MARITVEAYTARGRTVREIAMDDGSDGTPFRGTPGSIAAEMTDAKAKTGGDRFLFTEPLTRRSIAEVTDGPVPALRWREQPRRT